MANQLEDGNQEQKLLDGAKAQAPENPAVDVLVSNAGEKRYLWTARAFAIVTAISLCCNIVLILAITQLMPLYRIEPFLLTFQDKKEQVYNIVPVRGNMDNEKAITEVFVREYVLLRSSFDTDIPEMEARWMPGGPLQEMSSSGVYAEFIEKTANRALDIIRTKSLVRGIRILSVNELGRGLWQVEYETQDMYPTSTSPEKNYWTASLRVNYRRKTVKYGERLDNPIGFTVTQYSLTHNKVN
jgi:type IV secretory pathway component VirB8